MFSTQDHGWMKQAIVLAKQAANQDEVPVGAVIVQENKVIGEGCNQSICKSDPSAHAEINALRKAGEYLNNYRLINTTLYVTLEPCMMCIGALVHARVRRVVFGAYDPKSGAVESIFQIGSSDKFNHKIQYQGGLLADQCGNLLREFFKVRRIT